MKPFHLLRIAAVITLLYFAGHTLGRPWTPYTTPDAVAVLDAMKTHAFQEQGFKGTYWDLYYGFGLLGCANLLVQAAVLWCLASIAKTDAARLRPIIGILLIGFVVNAALSLKYFFIVPVVMSGVIALCLAMSLVLAGRSTSERV